MRQYIPSLTKHSQDIVTFIPYSQMVNPETFLSEFSTGWPHSRPSFIFSFHILVVFELIYLEMRELTNLSQVSQTNDLNPHKDVGILEKQVRVSSTGTSQQKPQCWC